MNSAAYVDNMISNWRTMGLSKAEIVVLQAEAMLGWPYVWGASGQDCTPDKRTYFMNRSSIPEGDRANVKKRCQVLNGSAGSCSGCQFYPGGARTRIQDCQGFEKEIHQKVGISLKGGGATSMYNDNSNWIQKGKIADMPDGAVCLVFKHNSTSGRMEHVGQHIGGGNIIHCSGTVKRGKISDGGWTHYAIPKGLDEIMPDQKRPTIRRGSEGEAVKELQQDLMLLNYDIGASGADGIYGRKTEAAVKAFQNNNGLTADGITGEKTWNAILKAVENIAPGEKQYTVTIPGLTKDQAEELKAQYENAEIREE